MKFKMLFLGIMLLAIGVNAQDPVVQKSGNKITAADLKEFLSRVAAEGRDGRESGTRGDTVAAACIAGVCQEIGRAGRVIGS
jgi:hypothetical protein